MRAPTRREFLGLGVGGVAATSLGIAFWHEVLRGAETQGPRAGAGYGPLGPPDENGMRLPSGFRSRLVARGGERVAGTDYVWHAASDGAATFPASGGGYVLVSNSETFRGGASAVRFGGDGSAQEAYRILAGTTQNCSGGGTPWGTWLSCEEVEGGQVWECDPTGRREAVARPAMGLLKHEAAAVDPAGRRVYLTEDLVDGALYRFTPERWRDLARGRLEVASVGRGGAVSWREVPDPSARRTPTRRQLEGTTAFKRGEGIWLDRGVVYVATTADHRVHAYDTRSERIEVLYDGLASPRAPLLRVDQLTASRAGELFVCEDLNTKEIDMGVIERSGRVATFLSVTGPQHEGSELTGVAFDPSGSRLYLASQRARPPGAAPNRPGPGAVFEVSGPFRGRRAEPA